jgi:hypothetical protein
MEQLVAYNDKEIRVWCLIVGVPVRGFILEGDVSMGKMSQTRLAKYLMRLRKIT